eukprot:119458-Pyramimonas_sp.AAC.1
MCLALWVLSAGISAALRVPAVSYQLQDDLGSESVAQPRLGAASRWQLDQERPDLKRRCSLVGCQTMEMQGL